jgi:hypothetical protein
VGQELFRNQRFINTTSSTESSEKLPLFRGLGEQKTPTEAASFNLESIDILQYLSTMKVQCWLFDMTLVVDTIAKAAMQQYKNSRNSLQVRIYSLFT